jgi:hypothetical protein
MTRRLVSRISLAFAVLASAFAVIGPASPSRADTGPLMDGWSDATTVGQTPIYWVYCHNLSSQTFYIFLQRSHISCASNWYGFVSLSTGNASHTVEVCLNTDEAYPEYLTEVVNPANADGSATGETIWYTSYSRSSCYVRTLGYPIRKFQATAELQGYSDWRPPFPPS